jgi:hypothetical protein
MKVEERPGEAPPAQEDRGYRVDASTPAAGPNYAGSAPYAPPRRPASIVWPVILIGVGILLLLSTFNILDWNAWGNLWRLWPLILVAVGLEILIGRRSVIASLVIAGLLVVAVAAALTFWAWMPFSGQSVTTDNVNQPLQGATAASASIDFGVGNLNIGALAGTDQLVSGRIAHGDRETITQDFHTSGNTAYYTIKSKTDWVFPFFDQGGTNRDWNLNLNANVPTDLSVNTGVGTANLDLQGLNLTSLDLNTGTGSTIVTLPAHGSFNAGLNAGVGDLTINIPASMAARIHLDSGLGNRDVPANYTHTGNVYESPGYTEAKDRVDLNISAGVGNIRIDETQPQP